VIRKWPPPKNVTLMDQAMVAQPLERPDGAKDIVERVNVNKKWRTSTVRQRHRGSEPGHSID